MSPRVAGRRAGGVGVVQLLAKEGCTSWSAISPAGFSTSYWLKEGQLSRQLSPFLSGQRMEGPLVQSSGPDQGWTLLPSAVSGKWPSRLLSGWSLDPCPDDRHIGGCQTFKTEIHKVNTNKTLVFFRHRGNKSRMPLTCQVWHWCQHSKCRVVKLHQLAL